MNKEELVKKHSNYRESLRKIDSDIGYLNQQVAMKRDLFLEINGRKKELEEIIRNMEDEEFTEIKEETLDENEERASDEIKNNVLS